MNADVPGLPVQLLQHPDLVRVRNYLTGGLLGVPLLELVRGPFCVLEEDRHFVIYGYDRRTGKPGKARLVEGYLQYANACETWSEGPSLLALYVPEF
jgi:hypothetical protein